MIQVTQTFLPPLEEYNAILKRAWDSKWMTNRGVLIQELEHKLRDRLDLDHLLITNNGTIPLQIALKLLAHRGEVITTPFSYVATTAAIVWENCTPVFVDIHPAYLSIDETKIEAAITPKTTAILATHVFGNPCAIEHIEALAKKYNLAVIYDAAHCFGVKYQGASVFSFGDVSTCSFHATKLFHTGEGGALICNTAKWREQMFYSHNFGHNGPLDFHGLGINAKISELQGAMGLAVLPYMEHIISERKKVVDFYLENIDFSVVSTMKLRADTQWNYSYFPILFESEDQLLAVEKVLHAHDINPRRYFYPSLNTIPYVNSVQMPVSESISKRIMCLPLYVGLEQDILKLITNLINTTVC